MVKNMFLNMHWLFTSTLITVLLWTRVVMAESVISDCSKVQESLIGCIGRLAKFGDLHDNYTTCTANLEKLETKSKNFVCPSCPPVKNCPPATVCPPITACPALPEYKTDQWFAVALIKIVRNVLKLADDDCQNVTVIYNAARAKISLQIKPSTNTTEKEAAITKELATIAPDMQLDFEYQPLPSSCIQSCLDPNVRESLSLGIGPADYKLWQDEDGVAVIKYGYEVEVKDKLACLPLAADCTTLGEQFEQAISLKHRSFPKFFVVAGETVQICRKKDVQWVPIDIGSIPEQAHVILHP